jgi:hypothetical protein
MYHYRVLPATRKEPTTNELMHLEKDVQYWEESLSIRNRLLAIQHAPSDIVLLLEYIPNNLYEWLSKQMLIDNDTESSACEMVENQLLSTISFMNTH